MSDRVKTRTQSNSLPHLEQELVRLGGEFPPQSVFLNLRSCCYYQSSFLPRIHLIRLFPLYTISIYHQGLTCQYFWYILLVISTNFFRGDIWGKQVRESVKFYLKATVAVADMSGVPAMISTAQESARNAKAPIGIDLISSARIATNENQRSLLWR